MKRVVSDADSFFEVSYEVANKVGGIYAVIKSKTAEMSKYYDFNYYTIGFYNPAKAKVELEEEDPGRLKAAFARLEKKGIKCHFGRWASAETKPKCILVDISGYSHNLNDIKKELWEKYNIDSLRSDSWFGDPVVWSYACGMLLEEIVHEMKYKRPVAQFHEWMAGVGLLYLKSRGSKISTVFTTHATMLGRCMASFNVDLVNEIENGLKSGRTVDPSKAYEYSVEAKHQTEVACASNSDVFTTVSETTAREAEYILGKKPDVVLPNGLGLAGYPSMEECIYLHRKYKDKIVDFLRGYFKPYYEVNLSKPRVMFISGRYEIRNKGVDIFIRSLGELNREMKERGDEEDVFAFIMIPTGIRGVNREVLENMSLFSDIKEYVDDLSCDISSIMTDSFTSGETQVQLWDHLSDYQKIEIKKLAGDFKAKSGGVAPLCAFDLENHDSDVVLRLLLDNGLCNRKEDKVKVIYYPAYLSNSDKMLSLSYNSFVLGCTLGVFPSSYEPWGYTPLETVANGGLTITTDLAGYGKFMEPHVDGKTNEGIYVLKRKNRSDDVIVADLKNMIFEVVKLDRSEIISRKYHAKRLSWLADWNVLAKNYVVAHNLAVERQVKKK